jgi:predicted RND superfamily exporter protein
MYLVQGSISIIALGAGAIVMGIAIDYSIHFLSHARHATNMRETIRELQAPLTIGSFTTVAAFLFAAACSPSTVARSRFVCRRLACRRSTMHVDLPAAFSFR